MTSTSRAILATGSLLAAVAVVATTARLVPPAGGGDGLKHRGKDLPFYVARGLAREAVAREVVAGRMSLSAAAAVNGWLNQLPPALSLPGQLEGPNRWLHDGVAVTEADFQRLQVLAYARSLTEAMPARLAEIEAEFRRACAAPGGAGLPAVVERDCREMWGRAMRAAHVAVSKGTRIAPVSLEGLRLTVDR